MSKIIEMSVLGTDGCCHEEPSETCKCPCHALPPTARPAPPKSSMDVEIDSTVEYLLGHAAYANKMPTDALRAAFAERVRMCASEILKLGAIEQQKLADKLTVRR